MYYVICDVCFDNMSKKKLKNQSGYTLAELIVSIAVIVIISAISLVNFRSSNNSGASSMAAQKIASDIRKVQGWALSLKDFDPTSHVQSWGICFSRYESAYSFYIDDDGNDVCEDGCSEISIERRGDPVDVLNDLQITDIFLDGASLNRGQITFNPPEPLIYICRNAFNQCDYEEIVIEIDGTRRVIVNKYGMVDVD